MEDRNIHVVEQGDSWEVLRKGDSMPLGTYVTLGEAEEQARAQAEIDGVQVVEHDAGYQATEEPEPTADADGGDQE